MARLREGISGFRLKGRGQQRSAVTGRDVFEHEMTVGSMTGLSRPGFLRSHKTPGEFTPTMSMETSQEEADTGYDDSGLEESFSGGGEESSLGTGAPDRSMGEVTEEYGMYGVGTGLRQGLKSGYTTGRKAKTVTQLAALAMAPKNISTALTLASAAPVIGMFAGAGKLAYGLYGSQKEKGKRAAHIASLGISDPKDIASYDWGLDPGTQESKDIMSGLDKSIAEIEAEVGPMGPKTMEKFAWDYVQNQLDQQKSRRMKFAMQTEARAAEAPATAADADIGEQDPGDVGAEEAAFGDGGYSEEASAVAAEQADAQAAENAAGYESSDFGRSGLGSARGDTQRGMHGRSWGESARGTGSGGGHGAGNIGSDSEGGYGGDDGGRGGGWS